MGLKITPAISVEDTTPINDTKKEQEIITVKSEPKPAKKKTTIYDSAFSTTKPKPENTATNSMEAISLGVEARKIDQEEQPLVFTFKKEPKKEKVVYYISRPAIEKLRKYADTQQVAPSRVIEQLINKFVPTWALNQRKENK